MEGEKLKQERRKCEIWKRNRANVVFLPFRFQFILHAKNEGVTTQTANQSR